MQKPDVLIVDDRPENLVALESSLADLDVNCVTASSGEEALSLALDHDFAVILMDVQMPVLDGFQTVELLRGSKKTRSLPVIFVTAINKDKRHVIRGYVAGAVDYLFKPLDTDVLRSKVGTFVELHQQRKLIEQRATELRYKTEELRRTNEELCRRNRELEEFNHLTNHDLKEPLRTLVSFSELLRNELGESVSEQVDYYVSQISFAAKRMHSLIQDILQLSRVTQADLKLEDVSLDDCVDRALRRLEPSIREASATIKRDTLPSVRADMTLMTALYRNLISNAVKFSPGGPTIHLTAERDGEGWILGVKDNGIGLRAEYAEKIFAPFQRLHGRWEYSGCGMGLAICRKAVERHDGRIWVESEPDRGAHFKFRLGDACG